VTLHPDPETSTAVRFTGNAALLRSKIRLALPWLAAAAGEFWEHPALASLFPEYLVRVQATGRASMAMMRAAQQRAASLAADDPVAARLAVYWEKHLRDEEEHPDWLLADMEALGMDRGRLLAAMPHASVARLVGPLYFWVHHAHPAAPLGFFAVLEGYPPDAEHLTEVMRRTGLPPAAFRTMLAHAEIDIHHRQELYDLLDELPLTPDQAELIAVCAFHTITGVAEIFGELVAATDGR